MQLSAVSKPGRKNSATLRRYLFLIDVSISFFPITATFFFSSLPGTDQSHSASFSSENEAQGGDSAAWQQCTPPPSTSPSGEMPAHPPPSQPGPRPRSRPASQSPSPPSALTGTKKRGSKPAHMRRNIRYGCRRLGPPSFQSRRVQIGLGLVVMS